MSNYEEEYFILISTPFRRQFLDLRATLETGRRHHTYEQLDYGDGPIFFENSYKGEVPFYLANAQMDAIYPVVSKDIAEVLNKYQIDGFQLFPSVIIDDDGEWHEEFYFFNLYKPLDCVDFEHSVVRSYKPNSRRNEVLEYKLRSDILDVIPQENRLIIRLDRVVGGAIIVHEKIVNKLSKIDIEAFQFYPLSEYRLGMEFKTRE